MSNGFSQYQQSQLGVSAAKARATSESSYAQFRTGLTAIQEKEALERAADQLEKIAKEAEENARKRGRRVSFGRLLGSIAGYAIGGPAGKAALGTALGSLAGQAAAGGFKSYDVEVPDSLVPGGVFYGREREAFRERAQDLEDAFEELTKQQRDSIGKNVFVDYLTGRGLGKLGEAKIGDLGVSLDDLLETGQISKKEYLVDVLRSAAGGIGEDRLSVLRGKLSDGSVDKFVAGYTDPTNLIGKYATKEAVTNKPEELKKLLAGVAGLDIDTETGNLIDLLQPRAKITPVQEQMEAISKLVPDYPVNNSTQGFDVDVFRQINSTPPALQQNRTMYDALNRKDNILLQPINPYNSLRQIVPQSFSGAGRNMIQNDLLGLLNEEQINLLMDNPYDFINSYNPRIGNLSKRNSLFNSTVGPMRRAG